MKWMEIVRLRAPHDRGRESAAKLLESATALKGMKGLLETRVFMSAAYECDLSMHLLWETESLHQEGSDIGLRIEQRLKGEGLVDHSVWVEMGGR